VNVKRLLVFIVPSLILLAWNVGPVAAQSPTPRSLAQQFFCSGGYATPECHVQVAVLKAALRKYPTKNLGDWTWVVVRSNEWKRVLSDRKVTLEIPAFTYLPERQTFFDEALLKTASPRGVELAASWHMTIPELLDLAIRHEMGHALCKERDEAAAKRTAQLLLDAPTIDTLRACRAKKPNV
jgi:hypothetical protein